MDDTSYPLMIPNNLPATGFGAMNWRGLWSLFARECSRFFRIYIQTLFAPVVTTLLFYAVFRLGIGGVGRESDGARMDILVGGLPFMDFLVPGLVMMAVAQNAFFNTSSALILAKIQGHVVDVLMAPLSPFETALAHVAAGVLRGVLVGVLAIGAIALVGSVRVVDPLFVVFFGVMGALMLSLLGLLTGILGDRFEQLAVVQNLVVMPATFLSGTFFAVGDLPPLGQTISYANPFFYMIDGFRYGLTGQADGRLDIGISVLVWVNLALFGVVCSLIARGRGLKN